MKNPGTFAQKWTVICQVFNELFRCQQIQRTVLHAIHAICGGDDEFGLRPARRLTELFIERNQPIARHVDEHQRARVVPKSVPDEVTVANAHFADHEVAEIAEPFLVESLRLSFDLIQ